MSDAIDAHIVPALASLAVPIDTLSSFPGNPRRGDIHAIAKSLSALGQHRPIVVDRENRIVVGNHTWQAAKQLGWGEIAAISVDDDEATSRARLLADNRTGDLGTYDDDDLAEMLSYVVDVPELLMATAYGADDIERLVHGPETTGETDPDDVPTVPDAAVTSEGDVWRLGEHRVVCGDTSDPGALKAALGGAQPALLVTDPPYGVGIGEKNRVLSSVGKGNRHEGQLSGDQDVASVEALWRTAFPALRSVLPSGTPYYVFGPQGGELGLLLLLLLREGGLAARHILVWVKHRASFSLGRLDYEYAHEPIAYGWVEGAGHPWFGAGTQTSVFEIPRPTAAKLHPTMKPVELYRRLIENSSRRGDVVLDGFGGSGTAVIACHQAGRRAAVIELDRHYCDVICRRYQEFTSEKPVLEATGAPHDFAVPS